MQEFGKFLFLAGIGLALLGLLLWWGRLPGDFFVEKQNIKFYFPLTTSLLLSVLLSLLLWFFRR